MVVFADLCSYTVVGDCSYQVLYLCYCLACPYNCTSLAPESLSEMDMQTFYNEVEVLKKVSMAGNPHVTVMMGYIAQENPPAIVMEFAPLGTLHDFIIKVKDEVSTVCQRGFCS